MEIIEILINASLVVYDTVNKIIGTDEASIKYGKGAGGDVSRKIDIVAEEAVINYFQKIGFACTILGEECGRIKIFEKSKGMVIMDAMDGTANAIRGIPFFCCSLAYSNGNEFEDITDCVIIDLVSKDIYRATKGRGAYYNNQKITIRKTTNKIISINTSGSIELLIKLLPIFKTHNHIRHLGANALEMAFFSRGLIDIILGLRPKVRIQDIAAGYLLIKEAGGVILDCQLKPLVGNFSNRKLSFIAINKNTIKYISKRINALGGI